VTAGASTPDDVIAAVVDVLHRFGDMKDGSRDRG